MGRVLEEVVLQGLGLTGSGLILAGFQGYHVVEHSHLHSCQNSPHEDITCNQSGAACKAITKVGRIPMLGHIIISVLGTVLAELHTEIPDTYM